eukprot:373718-Hanusia_phi.AAC.3
MAAPLRPANPVYGFARPGRALDAVRIKLPPHPRPRSQPESDHSESRYADGNFARPRARGGREGRGPGPGRCARRRVTVPGLRLGPGVTQTASGRLTGTAGPRSVPAGLRGCQPLSPASVTRCGGGGGWPPETAAAAGP